MLLANGDNWLLKVSSPWRAVYPNYTQFLNGEKGGREYPFHRAKLRMFAQLDFVRPVGVYVM